MADATEVKPPTGNCAVCLEPGELYPFDLFPNGPVLVCARDWHYAEGHRKFVERLTEAALVAVAPRRRSSSNGDGDGDSPRRQDTSALDRAKQVIATLQNWNVGDIMPTYDQIAAYLNKIELATPSGKPWSGPMVHNTLSKVNVSREQVFAAEKIDVEALTVEEEAPRGTREVLPPLSSKVSALFEDQE